MTTDLTAAPARSRFDPLQELARDSAYLLTGLPLAVASFIVLVTGLAIAAGLVIVWVGVPLALLTLWAARVFAEVERARLRALGIDLPPASYRRVGWGIRQQLVLLRDPQCWLDALHGMVVLPLATVTWSVAVTWWSGTLAGLTYWFWGWWLPNGGGRPISAWLGWDGTYADNVVNTAIGFVFLITLGPVLRGCTTLQTGLGRILLANEQVRRLQGRVDQLTASRAAVVKAEAQSLRRLERDIHDGPQQRLVRLGMDLSVAERRLADRDPEAARTLLGAARTQTAEALSELRAHSRGIAPPILADRGLVAALAAVTARCTVEAHLQVDLRPDTRLPASVENAAYFIVSEALANVAKHSLATRVQVRAVRDGATLHLEIEDDGVGGAHPAKGHGLAGLADRVAGIEGSLAVTSPPGGPTLVRADIPCA